MPVPKKNNTPIIIAACAGGGLLLLIIIIVAATSGGGGGGDYGANNGEKDVNRPEPVDVSGMEREGEILCSEGYGIVQSVKHLMTKSNLSGAEQSSLKAKLKVAKAKIQKGLAYYEKAMMKSGNKYELRQYTQAMKTIGMKINELND